MELKSNTELQNSAKGRRNGLLGTVVVHFMLFGLLILAGFSSQPPLQSEEGILVNFGTDETGSGLIEPSPPAFQEATSAPAIKEPASSQTPVTKSRPKTNEEALLTQNTDDAPAVKKVDPEVLKKKKEKIEADRIIREQLEAERVIKRQEEAERKKIEADQQRASDISNKTKNALANSRNTGTSSTGEGVTGGAGNQGDPNGSVNSKVRGAGSGLGNSGTGTGGKGISYKLEGRSIQALPTPKYDYQEEGIVVVEVSVDRSGKVVQAIPGARGSTTLNDYLLRVAKEAALGASFAVKQDAPAIQKGTITYNFILK